MRSRGVNNNENNTRDVTNKTKKNDNESRQVEIERI